MSKLTADKVEAHVLTYDSVCTIDANLSYLTRLLERVLILDGGSTDGTLDIIKSKNVELYQYEQAPEPYNYREDFARSYLMKHAKAEWILFIDSDEIYEESFFQELPQLIESGAKAWAGNFLQFFNIKSKSHDIVDDGRPRLVRNKNITFKGERATKIFLDGEQLAGDVKGVQWMKSGRMHFHWIDLGREGKEIYNKLLPIEYSLIKNGRNVDRENASRSRYYDYEVYKKIQKENSALTRNFPHYQQLLIESIGELFSNVDKSAKILDIGCGDGYSLDVFKKNGFMNVIGMDINNDKLKTAKEHNHTVHACDITKMPFKDGEFDYIFCSHTLEHCFVLLDSLRELKRVIKPGCKMFIIVPFGNNNNGSHLIKFLEEDYLLNIIKEAGWKVESSNFRTRNEHEQWIICNNG